MLNAENFYTHLIKKDLFFLTGVPCSFLKNFLEVLQRRPRPIQHIIAPDEGSAIGIAAGYHFATGKVPIIYLQNSGFGNAINPLTSLMDQEIYSIPAILFITWRGEPGTPDEPQHLKMGKILPQLLDDLNIPTLIASSDLKTTIQLISKLKNLAIKNQQPVALIFKSNLFEDQSSPSSLKEKDRELLQREEILELLLPTIGKHPIITTTGKTSRELFEYRERHHQSHENDFLTVGSMGCASSIALGIALWKKRKVFVIDGDGAVIMKMGILGTINQYHPSQFVHIIIDNKTYESTGGQPTTSTTLRWKPLLTGVGYQDIRVIQTRDQIKKINFLNRQQRPRAIVILAKPGSRSNLGRPTTTPLQNKKKFMRFLSEY